MTSLDQLHNALRDDIFDYAQEVGEDGADPYEIVDRFLAVLTAASSDPARLRVVLEAIGLEAREGYAPSSWDGTVEMGFSPDALFDTDVPVLVCRVRTREETADG